MEKIILYTTHCPKCNILKKKLENKHVIFEEIDDVNVMIEKGMQSAPVLEINGEQMNYINAVKYLNNL